MSIFFGGCEISPLKLLGCVLPVCFGDLQVEDSITTEPITKSPRDAQASCDGPEPVCKAVSYSYVCIGHIVSICFYGFLVLHYIILITIYWIYCIMFYYITLYYAILHSILSRYIRVFYNLWYCVICCSVILYFTI